MPTVNERLQDDIIDHAVSLQKYSNGVVRRVIALLNRSDARLVAELAAALERLPADSFTVQRLEILLGSVRRINAAAYQQVFGALDEEITAFSAYEAGWQYQSIASTLPEPVLVRFPVAEIAPAQVKAAALSRPFQGRLLKDWAATVEADRMTIIRNNIRTGYIEGKTPSEIVRGIRGSRARNYADGLLERPRRELMTVVQTAISHTAASARDDMYNSNEDLIKGVKWVSTLDSKTSQPCRIRDNKLYTLDHKPKGHKIPWLSGPGKIHFNCRSSHSPVTKSWRELGIPADEIDEGTRASMDGQVPKDIDFGKWLERQPKSRQIKVLGKERARLYSEGKLELKDFYDSKGQWLTLDQLRESDKAAFSRIAA